MEIEVPLNPNCQGTDQFVFQELESARPIRGLRISERGKDIDCDVVGVTSDGQFVQAYARKIADSGAGYAYLIYGGDWGIRLRPSQTVPDPWDLKDSRQIGEPFKIYAYEDILF